MNLYVLRHGIAEPLDGRRFRTDDERPLAPEGVEKMQRIGQTMRLLKIKPDLILTSPLLRARQTAEIVAGPLKARRKVQPSDALAPEGRPATLIKQLRALKPAPNEVVLVGHEPYLSHLISWLCTGGGDLAIKLKKGGLCALEIDTLKAGRCATLLWLMAPRQMLRIS